MGLNVECVKAFSLRTWCPNLKSPKKHAQNISLHQFIHQYLANLNIQWITELTHLPCSSFNKMVSNLPLTLTLTLCVLARLLSVPGDISHDFLVRHKSYYDWYLCQYPRHFMFVEQYQWLKAVMWDVLRWPGNFPMVGFVDFSHEEVRPR